jgi:hypothetical protein
MGRPMIDITGKRFGRLVVLERVPWLLRHNAVDWKCLCDCGTETIVRGTSLRQGDSKSCGCLVVKHGLWGGNIYPVWAGMIQRCENPNSEGYEYYGGRGVKVCERWRHSPEAFADYMGPRPEGMTLDRYPKRNGDYEPGNCRWATPLQQKINTDRVDHAVGVRLSKSGRVFEARIRRGREFSLGGFDTAEEAIAVRRKVKEWLDEDLTPVNRASYRRQVEPPLLRGVLRRSWAGVMSPRSLAEVARGYCWASLTFTGRF